MVTAHALALTLALTSANEATLLEFSAPWCQPCRTMEPIMQRLAAAGYPIRKVNVEHDPNLAASHRVTGLPTFVMLVDGAEVDRVVGAASEARLQQMFERARVQPPASGVRGQSPEPERRIDRAPPDHRRMESAAASDLSGSREIGSSGSAEHALQATVRLRIDDPQGHSFGTGTVIDAHGPEMLVVTCGHIFRDSGGKGAITVETFLNGTVQQAAGQLISHDLKRDIGLVSFTPSQALPPVVVARSGQGIEVGAAVFSVGCDHGQAPSVRHSRIADVDKYLGPPNIEVEGQPVVGRSGGGLFAANGDLIGICNFADPADNEGIYASLATIHWELDRIGQRRVYQPEVEVALASNRSAGSRAADVPAMPERMPRVPAQNLLDANQRNPGGGGLTAAATAASGHGPADDLEVICIVRSRSRRDQPGRVYVLEQPSRDLLSRLTGNPTTGPRGGLVPLAAARQSRNQPVVRAQSEHR